MFNGFFDFFVSAILAMVTAVTQILLGVALYAGWLRAEVLWQLWVCRKIGKKNHRNFKEIPNHWNLR